MNKKIEASKARAEYWKSLTYAMLGATISFGIGYWNVPDEYRLYTAFATASFFILMIVCWHFYDLRHKSLIDEINKI